MRRFGRAIGSLGFLAGALSLGTSATRAHDVRAGVMTCDLDSGFGFVVGSSRDLHCTFLSTTGNPEHYAGSISKFGVDIGYVQNAVIVWTVVAPTVALPPGSLAGSYGGATASATVGVGVGANVLIGGSANSISLQPVSIEGTTGLNVAAGIASLTLQCAPGP